MYDVRPWFSFPSWAPFPMGAVVRIVLCDDIRLEPYTSIGRALLQHLEIKLFQSCQILATVVKACGEKVGSGTLTFQMSSIGYVRAFRTCHVYSEQCLAVYLGEHPPS